MFRKREQLSSSGSFASVSCIKIKQGVKLRCKGTEAFCKQDVSSEENNESDKITWSSSSR